MLIGNIYERSWHFFGISNWGMMALFFLSWDIPSSHRWQVLSSTQAFEILAEFNVQDEYATEATTTVIIHTRSFGLKADVDGLVWGAYFCLLSRFVADKKTYIYIYNKWIVGQNPHSQCHTAIFWGHLHLWAWAHLAAPEMVTFHGPGPTKETALTLDKAVMCGLHHLKWWQIGGAKIGIQPKTTKDLPCISPKIGGEMVVKVAKRHVLWGCRGCHYQTLGYWSLTYKK